MVNFLQVEAYEHSQNCFLNSFLREWKDYKVFLHGGRKEIHLAIEGVTFVLPVRRYSMLGRHQFKSVFYFLYNGAQHSLDFNELVEKLCALLKVQYQIADSHIETFQHRIANSIKVIEKSLTRYAQSPTDQKGDDFRFFEQNLLIGHCFHPTPKSREQFSEEDLLQYSPELGGKFPLVWLAVSDKILFQRSATSFADLNWTRTLLQTDNPNLLSAVPQGFISVPMHPWQFSQLQQSAIFSRYFASGKIILLGGSLRDWYPTSSLRTVYQSHSPYMLKFSMSVRLTNSVRHLLPKEVDRGLQLAEVMQTPLMKEFQQRYPQFQILLEPAFLGFKDDRGELIPESVLVCRENPFTEPHQENKAVLATLTQDELLGQKTWLARLMAQSQTDEIRVAARTWFQDFLRNIVEPILIAQSDYGVVLGAHQQNIIVVLKEGRPVGSYFRDCQGTGYTRLGFQNFAHLVPAIVAENENVLDEVMGLSLFTYYLIINSTFSVITTLASGHDMEESVFVADLREFLQSLLRRGVQDPSLLSHLLQTQELMSKGNFFCSLRGTNENTTENPLALYQPIANPLAFSFEVSYE